MKPLLFVLGRTADLSYLELVSRFKTCTRLTHDCAMVEFPENVTLDPVTVLQRLGGTIKIAKILGSALTLDAHLFANYLLDIPGVFTFGISFYGNSQTFDTKLLLAIKHLLTARGIHSRYVTPHEGITLSSVVVDKKKITELIVVSSEEGFTIGHTLAVQNVDLWSKRDIGRPFIDSRSGMLPLKVARMAVNIAAETGTLLDPFCGMGTILGEALLLGWQVVGSDQSEEVIMKAKKNIDWLKTSAKIQFIVSDATHISKHLPTESIDAIVTEPFLGSTQWGDRQVKNIIKGLEKLYIGCLRDWIKVLKPAGKVVIALPQYVYNGRTYFVKNVIDRCEILGYTVKHGPIEYSRPQAIVRREFFVLVKK